VADRGTQALEEGHTAFRTLATPVQNNGSIYNVIYTYTKGPWIIQPYLQYTQVPTDLGIGVAQGADTHGGALLLNYNFKHGMSLAGRAEYISSTGSASNGAVNLMFDPGSGGWSSTLTPHLSEEGLLCTRRPFLGSSGQLHPRPRLWAARHESDPSSGHD
jgi:hypothetical protein